MAPHVLIVDDEAETLGRVRDAFSAVMDVDLVHPRDVRPQHLERASAILVDFQLEDWEERYSETGSASMQPLNGLALAAVYRSFVEAQGRPVAISLYSAQLSLVSPIPSEIRPHVVAQLASLQWVFPKVELGAATAEEGLASLVRRVNAMAVAVEALPDAWPDDPERVRDLVEEYMGIPEGDAARWDDVVRCHPPMYEMSESSHGLWFLNWLLQQILPYPTCLIDGKHLAARLEVTADGLNQILESAGDLADKLSDARYHGLLDDFDGARWWSVDVSRILQELRETSGDDDMRSALAREVDGVAFAHGDQLRVCYDGQLLRLDVPYPVDATVEISPDGWPIYAEHARAPRELLAEPAIAALAARSKRVAVVRIPPDS